MSKIPLAVNDPVAIEALCRTQAVEKAQVRPFYGCCTADSQTDTGRHQLYNNSSLVHFSLRYIRTLVGRTEPTSLTNVGNG